MKRTLILSILLSLTWQLGSLALARGSNGETRAAELVAKARQAIGGDAKLKSIKSLSITGTYRRVMGERETTGDSEFELLLPDRIRRSETMNIMPGIEMTRTDVLNGSEVWSDAQSSGAHAGGGGVVIRRAPEGGPEVRANSENAVRADLARTSLAFLLSTPSTVPLEYTYVGEAEAPDGKAEVIDVTGPNNFSVRIFLDQKTSRPLMMTYKGRAPRYTMRTITGPQVNREEMDKRAQEEAAKAAAAPDVEFQLSLDDYREVNGVLFPHSLSRMVDGKTTEETTIKKIVVNPQIKPDRFEKK